MKSNHTLSKGLFITLAFLLGSINVLYNSIFYTFFIIAFIYNITTDWHHFTDGVKKNWKYLILPLIAIVYLVIHYMITRFLNLFSYRISWSILEVLLLYFFMIPLYIVSVRNLLTPSTIQRFLLALCWGILVFNFIKLFYLVGGSIFTDSPKAFEILYNGRFGGNLFLLKGFVLLEAQALYLAVSSVISVFFLFRGFLKRSWDTTFFSSIFIFIFSLVFLSFTVTKASILAFLCSFVFLAFIYFLRMTIKQRIFWGGILIICLLGSYYTIPDTVKKRINEMNQEINQAKQGEISGGTVAPRLALWEEDFRHFNEWGVFGLGVYKKYAVREWYQNSSYTFIHDLRNTHNSFLDFWLLGGIAGLLFFCFYFFAPIRKMIRQKKFSALIIALLITLVVANNTCLLIALVDTSSMIIFILAIAFLQLENFHKLEYTSTQSQVK